MRQTTHISGFAAKMRTPLGRETVEEALYGKLPDYDDDPHIWTQRVRGMMASKMRKRGIALGYTKDRIIDDAFRAAEHDGALGDLRATWRCFGKTYRAYMKARSETPRARLEAYGRALKLPEQQIADILRMPGRYSQPASYEDLMGKAALKMQAAYKHCYLWELDMSQTELDDWFGKRDKPLLIAHWTALNAPTLEAQVASAFNHFKRELGKLKTIVYIADDVSKALGGATIETHIKDKGVKETVTALQSYLLMLAELSLEKGGLEASQTTPPAIPIPGRVSDAPEAAVASIVNAIPDPTIELNKGATMSDSPDLGSVWTVVIINGHAMHITAKKGETPDDVANNVFTVLDGLKKVFADERCKSYGPVLDGRDKVEYLKGEAKAAQPPALSPAAPPTLPPTPQPADTSADSKGRVPGQTGTSKITGVEKKKESGNVVIELWAAGKYAEHRLKLDTEHAFLRALGYDVDKMEVGERYAVNWIADWVVSGNRANNGQGNYYLNVTGIHDNAVALPKAS